MPFDRSEKQGPSGPLHGVLAALLALARDNLGSEFTAHVSSEHLACEGITMIETYPCSCGGIVLQVSIQAKPGTAVN